MNNIWFSADWHLGHENIVKGVSKLNDLSACRDFKTLEEHNEILIQNINKCADSGDRMYLIGDFILGGRKNIYEIWNRLTCKNIHLILGNHDHFFRKNAIILNDKGEEIRSQTLFSSVSEILSKTIGSERMVLCHYSMRTWENGHNGSWMLYGHSHGYLADYSANLPIVVNDRDGTHIKNINSIVKFKTMDVGVDTHSEFRPYHIDEIRAEMTNRIPLRVDHYDDLTL